MTLKLSQEIKHERVVLSRLHKRSIQTNNLPIKKLCGERTSALMAFLWDLNKEEQAVKSNA